MSEEKKVLYSEQQIKLRVAEIAKKISRDYEGKDLILIGILKGSFIFLADLVRFLTIPVTIGFVRISSYGSGTDSSGEIRIIHDIETSLEGKEVIIVEDIVDTGLTLFRYADILREKKPGSIKVCALIDKTHRREKSVTIDYSGFKVKDGFLVGYGLDFDEQYRHLPDIYLLPDELTE